LEFDSRVWGPPNEQKRKKKRKGEKRRKREKGKKKFESSKIGPLFWGPPNDLVRLSWGEVGAPKRVGAPKSERVSTLKRLNTALITTWRL